jgi:hypothetical protein
LPTSTTRGALLGLCLCLSGFAFAEAEKKPWRLDAAFRAPDWLELKVQHRLRYETVDSQFRARGAGGDQFLALQTLAHLRLGGKRAHLGLELQDSRGWLDDAGTPLDTGLVNSAELLQAYLEWTPTADSLPGALTLRTGRVTKDFGSRRLIARNRFRNTINNLTGLDAHFIARQGWEVETLLAMPVMRRPSNRRVLDDNAAALDEEDTGSAVWLAAWRTAPGKWQQRVELYVVGLEESDARFDTRNRRLFTPAFRLYRDPAPGRFDYQLEMMGQFGESRGSTNPLDQRDLDHFAHFESLYAGYTWVHALAPRLGILFDYASGDDDPTDGDTERFDTLFGARRGELGPSGIFGPFQRTNILSVGTRGNLRLTTDVQAMLSHRANWLASASDTWAAAGLRDTSGSSGRFVGHQVEFTVQWTVLKDTLNLELGGAWLSQGEFRQRIGGLDDPNDSTYLYTQASLSY